MKTEKTAKLEETQLTSIALSVFVMNLFKIQKRILVEKSEIGKFSGLAKIHKFLFGELYDFAGKEMTVNIAKGNFSFVKERLNGSNQ